MMVCCVVATVVDLTRQDAIGAICAPPLDRLGIFGRRPVRLGPRRSSVAPQVRRSWALSGSLLFVTRACSACAMHCVLAPLACAAQANGCLAARSTAGPDLFPP